MAHRHVIGEPLSGKSTLLKFHALENIKRGFPVIYIDPFGFDVDDLMNCTPATRIKNTILFDPTLPKMIKWNPLEDTTNISLIANTFTSTLRGVWEIKIVPPNINMMMKSLIYTSLQFNLTVLDCFYMIKKDNIFDKSQITNPVLRLFWDDYQGKKPRDKDAKGDSTFNKLYDLLVDSNMQRLFGETNGRLNILDAVENKTLFVRLPIAEMGADVVSIVGSLLLAQIHLAATRRDITVPLYIYIDGMKFFAPSIQAQMVAILGKYNVHFMGTYNNVDELDEELFTALMGNCQTVAFKASPKDTETVMKGYIPNNDARLENITPFHYRELPDSCGFREIKTKELPEPTANNMIERITNHTIEYFC